MKKNILLTTVAVLFAFNATAQTPMEGPTLSRSSAFAVPAELTSDNHTKIAVKENGTINFYNNSMSLVHQMATPAFGPHRIAVYDLDNHLQEPDNDNGLAITQTLFNNDNNYEYFVDDGYDEGMGDGMTVKSEDGSTIWSWHTTGGHWGGTCLVKWDGEYFIVTEEEMDEDVYTYTWYRINHNTQSISQVEGPNLKVWPTIARKDQVITIELGESNNATEIMVVNAIGKIIKKIPVNTGQTEVTFLTSDLESGMHIIGARDYGSCKIIVK